MGRIRRQLAQTIPRETPSLAAFRAEFPTTPARPAQCTRPCAPNWPAAVYSVI